MCKKYENQAKWNEIKFAQEKPCKGRCQPANCEGQRAKCNLKSVKIAPSKERKYCQGAFEGIRGVFEDATQRKVNPDKPARNSEQVGKTIACKTTFRLKYKVSSLAHIHKATIFYFSHSDSNSV